ncbi:MAG TPA: HAMP domain-containing sensor histidine kinase, partial [Adhaeribacter sp.]|nr:HAMP domain-containing sensor histidine kinase [Adhaeribacter sp.]
LEVAAVLEEVSSEINDLISATNAQINTSFASAPVVFMVAHDLKSILYNLLTNAIKFHAPDRPPVVNIETAATEKGTFIRVSDNGIGIDLPKHEHKIFAIFCRLTNTVSGTGIGLYIIKRILDNYRGKIKVKSTPGQGSTFEIFLPN